jgi:hypothetical protein
MLCKLCLKDKKLVRQSHIIPDFMYKDIFDEKHRLFEVTFTKDKDIIKAETEGQGLFYSSFRNCLSVLVFIFPSLINLTS